MPNQKIPTPPVMEVIGKYISLNKKLGEGACGQVFLASAKTDICKVMTNWNAEIEFPATFVVKVLKITMSTAHSIKHVYNEILTLQKLDHECVVGYLASWVEKARGSFRHRYCLAMKYCNGGDLHKLILDHKRHEVFVKEDIVFRVMLDVFTALQFMHSKKIIHRDIKPLNILLSIDQDNHILERALIGDYGLSRPIEDSKELVKSRVGTMLYCSPQIINGVAYSTKTDIFSAGITFFEMICKCRPFGESGAEPDLIFYDITHKDPIPAMLQITKGHYSNTIFNVVIACLAKNENRRPSATQVLTILCKQFPLPKVRHQFSTQTITPPLHPKQKNHREAVIMSKTTEDTKKMHKEAATQRTSRSHSPILQNETEGIVNNNIINIITQNENFKNEWKENQKLEESHEEQKQKQQQEELLTFSRETPVREFIQDAMVSLAADRECTEKMEASSAKNTYNDDTIITEKHVEKNEHIARSLSVRVQPKGVIAPTRPSLINRNKLRQEHVTKVQESNEAIRNTHNSHESNNEKHIACLRESDDIISHKEVCCSHKIKRVSPNNKIEHKEVIDGVFNLLYKTSRDQTVDDRLLSLVNNNKSNYIVLKVIAISFESNLKVFKDKVTCATNLLNVASEVNDIYEILLKYAERASHESDVHIK